MGELKKYNVQPFDFEGHKHYPESKPEQLVLHDNKMEIKFFTVMDVEDEDTKVTKKRVFRGHDFVQRDSVKGVWARYYDQHDVYQAEILTTWGTAFVFTCETWDIAQEIRKLIDDWLNT